MQLAPKPTSEHRPLEWFKPGELDLARHDDPEKIHQRGQDMLVNGQLHAVGATEDGRMIYGHGRFLSAKAAGLKSLEVKIYPASLPETKFRLIRVAENLHRTDLTAYQKWISCTELMCGNPDWKLQDLAQNLHVDPSMVTRLMSPSRCIPAWQGALKAGKVGLSDCYAASKHPESEQAALLELKLSGATRDQLEAKRRNKQATTTSAFTVKLSRVRCPLGTNGVVVTVSGPDMSLEQYIDSLQAALDAARRCKKENLDISTAQRVWADRSKAS
jgi:ParB family transcriptional regulator, chromosome partitioning protein